MTLVNAALRPSGASYRDNLIAGIPNKNPSKEIDELLAPNNGYLVYQEDIIRFLQEICGLSGSEADNIRRGIAHKEEKRLQAAMPKILEGYCAKSSHPREQAEQEAKTFIQIIKDASSYMFGRNHATGYSMVGYKCIYFRTYFPAEFIVGYLNSAKDIKDIVKGDELSNALDISYLNYPQVRERKAEIIRKFSDNENFSVNDLPEYPNKILIHRPTFGKSKGLYTLNAEEYAIYKGTASFKGLNVKVSNELYDLAQKDEYKDIENKTSAQRKKIFIHLIRDALSNTSLRKDQMLLLIRLNYFQAFAPDKTLENIFENVGALTSGFKFETFENKQYKKSDLPFLPIDLNVINVLKKSEAPATIRGINLVEYFDIVAKDFKDKHYTLKERLDFEEEKAGSFLTRLNTRSPYYYISDLKTYEYKNRPYFTLYNLKTGRFEKASVNDAKYYVNNKIEKGDLITNCKFEDVPKKAKVDGKTIVTDQFKRIIVKWSKSKKY